MYDGKMDDVIALGDVRIACETKADGDMWIVWTSITPRIYTFVLNNEKGH